MKIIVNNPVSVISGLFTNCL